MNRGKARRLILILCFVHLLWFSKSASSPFSLSCGFFPPLVLFFLILLRALLVLIFLSPNAYVYVMVLVLPFDHHNFFFIYMLQLYFLSQSYSSPLYFFLMVFYCLQTASDCAVLLCWAAYKTRVRDSPCLQEFMSNVNKAGSQRWVGTEVERSEVPGARLHCRAVPGPGWWMVTSVYCLPIYW